MMIFDGLLSFACYYGKTCVVHQSTIKNTVQYMCLSRHFLEMFYVPSSCFCEELLNLKDSRDFISTDVAKSVHRPSVKFDIQYYSAIILNKHASRRH